jgi:hypothetical protein
VKVTPSPSNRIVPNRIPFILFTLPAQKRLPVFLGLHFCSNGCLAPRGIKNSFNLFNATVERHTEPCPFLTGLLVGSTNTDTPRRITMQPYLLNRAQQNVIDCGILTSGFSCVLQMPTGTGKTWLANLASPQAQHRQRPPSHLPDTAPGFSR